MIPQTNQNITVVFKNSIQVDGVVIEWADDKAVLNTLQGTAVIVIPNPNQEILFYRITGAVQEYQKVVEKPNKSTQDLQRIIGLKEELSNIDKKTIREQFTIQNNYPLPIATENLNYGPLPFSAFKIPKQHSPTEVAKPNTPIGSGLQRLFAKKH